MSGGPRNIFLIARKGHEGDENQLTEMLAWLLERQRELIPSWLSSLGLEIEREDEWLVETQRAVPGGFLDLVLHARGRAIAVLESKLGSTTDLGQISKYVEYLKTVEVTGPRALVFTTQHPEQWPGGADAVAGDDVRLILRRWHALGDFLRTSESDLAQDFATMLEKEGLVTPDALTTRDWETWHRGYAVTRRLRGLINESAAGIQALEPNFEKSGGAVLSNNGLLYRLFYFSHIALGVAFWPTRKPTRPKDFATVVTYVLDRTLPETERKDAGLKVVERAATRQVAMSGWAENYVQRSVPVQDVLTGNDFAAQIAQLVSHVADSLVYFRGLGYPAVAHPISTGISAEPV